MNATGIEWAEAVWNPVVGCTRVSEGCRNCYAERFGARIANAALVRPMVQRTSRQAAYIIAMQRNGAGDGRREVRGSALPLWSNTVVCMDSALDEPLRMREPRRIFVNSQSDLFHEQVPFEYLDMVFAAMALSPQHRFLVLTKRPERMAEYTTRDPGEIVDAIAGGIHALGDVAAYGSRAGPAREKWERDAQDQFQSIAGRARPRGYPLPNLWLGVSVEDQATAETRIPLLLECPAAVRWVSYEPALGPLDLDFALLSWRHLLHWVVCGGESGPHARPAHRDWFRAVRDQCAVAGVPFFFKQWGEWAPFSYTGRPLPRAHKWGDGSYSELVGKKLAGRVLDGRTHAEYPAGGEETSRIVPREDAAPTVNEIA